MADEFQLQVRPKRGDSSLSVGKERSDLGARGRRDAAIVLSEPKARGDVGEGSASGQLELFDAGHVEEIYPRSPAIPAPPEIHDPTRDPVTGRLWTPEELEKGKRIMGRIMQAGKLLLSKAASTAPVSPEKADVTKDDPS